MNRLQISHSENNIVTLFVGQHWTKETLANTNMIEKDIFKLHNLQVVFDFAECTLIDSAGAVEIIRLKNKLEKDSCTVTYENILPHHLTLLEFYNKNFAHNEIPLLKKQFTFGELGYKSYQLFLGIINFFSFVGEMFVAIIKLLFSPRKFRFTAFIKHIQTTSIAALPIIMTLSFLIGLVVAYQAAGYLLKVGGDIFIVDLSVMSVFRELSPMIAAILIAARSASSFTAEIGTMKITEEIDAMRTMGFDPFIFLVIPRVFALICMMPFIVFAADMAGMVGALVVSQFHLGISFDEFIDRMYSEIAIAELYVGLAKAPIYGAIVAIVGCYQGFLVNKSTESIGLFTTRSVVNAIFWVIICDACIAVALTKLGI